MIDRYAIIRTSGRSENAKDGADYWSILDSVHTEFQSAGGNWDRPNMLIRNGKVVVESGLANLAWDYGQDLRKRRDAVWIACREEHKPEWL